MINYAMRTIWGPSAAMERDLAKSKAHALLTKLEEMQFYKQPRAEIWRTAVHCRALAVIAEDWVAASNAAEIVNRYAPRKRYSLAERLAIHRKAKALLKRLR